MHRFADLFGGLGRLDSERRRSHELNGVFVVQDRIAEAPTLTVLTQVHRFKKIDAGRRNFGVADHAEIRDRERFVGRLVEEQIG